MEYTSALKTAINPRKPWLWLAVAFVVYSLAVGVVLPWQLKKQLVTMADQRLDMALAIEKLRINPYLLSLTVENLTMELDGKPLLAFDRFHANFQLSSLFRRAWTFRELALEGVYLRAERFDDGDSDIARLARRWAETAPPPEPPEPGAEAKGGLPRFLIGEITLNLAEVRLIDRVPASDYDTTLGPLDLALVDFNSLPERTGGLAFDAETGDGAELKWRGTLALTPLHSDGTLSLRGFRPSAIAEYLRDVLEFTVADGRLDLDLRYRLDQGASGIEARIDELQATLAETRLVYGEAQAPLFSLDRLVVTGGELTWPARKVRVGDVRLAGGELWVERFADGGFNLTQLVRPAPDDTNASGEPPEGTASSGWQLHNRRLALENWVIHARDGTLDTPFATSTGPVDVVIESLGTSPEQPVTLSLDAPVADGRVTVEGSALLWPLRRVAAAAEMEGLDLSLLQPYIEPHALVTLTSGRLSGDAQVRADTTDAVMADLNAAVTGLEVLEQATDKPLLRWQRMAVDGVAADMAQGVVDIDGITLEQAYGAFEIAADGTSTLTRIRPANEVSRPKEPKGKEKPKGKEQREEQQESAADAEPASPLAVRIGHIAIIDSSGFFADESLPLPFATEMHTLNGGISTLISNSATPAEVDVEGQINEFGMVRIGGELAPFAPEQLTRIELDFRNVMVPPFSSYSVKFAGRKIREGRLDLDLAYHIENGNLKGENRAVLRDFQLGERVDQPGAMTLPLDLAVALLKDGEGKIDIDVPVSGNINDPEFSYGQVIGRAIANVITGIAAAPFRLLGRLVGAGGDDFGDIAFLPGRSDITPPAREKLVKLADAMAQRPQLQLVVTPVFAEEADSAVLRQQQYQTALGERLGKPAEETSLADETVRDTLENWYREAGLAPELAVLREQHTVDVDGDAELDTLAYARALRSALIAAQPVADQDLAQLARARAAGILDILLSGGIADQRLLEAEVKAVKSRKDTVVSALVLQPVNTET